MKGRLQGLALLVWLLSAPAPAAEILLQGHQHMGNNDGRCEFTPNDPVTHVQIRDYPSNFHLSQDVTISGVRLNNAIGVDDVLEVRIDGVVRSSSCASCSSCNLPDTIVCGGNNSCGDVVISLTPIFLPAGYHTISVRDADSSENDFGFSSLSLLTDNPSSSVMLNQRRHPGNNTLSPTDNDANDNYDITDSGSPYYPDVSEPHPMDIVFNLSQNRRISQIEFFRVRDVDNGLANAGKLFLDGIEIGPFPSRPTGFGTETFNTNFLALAGNHTLRVALGVISGNDVDSFSWDDIIIRTVDAAPAGVLGAFNATDTGELPLTGVIRTKVANKNFDLDLHAINSLGSSVNTAYTGTVTVDLLNAADNSGSLDIYGCRSSWTAVHTLGSVTFGGGDNGKKRLSSVSYPNALRIARVRVTDNATGARGCSTDALALRPKEFQADASHDNETTAGLAEALPTGGYSSTSTPRHKAGRPFTLSLVPKGEGGVTVTGYDGQPTVSAIVLEQGTVLGVATTGPWSWVGGVLRSDTVTYSEVGAVRLRVEDTSYADVDLADSTLTDRAVRKDDVKVGRFIPDHFRVTLGELEPACGSFSYVGQPFGYPGGTAVTLTAENAANITTLGYTGSLFRLPASIPQANFSIYDDPDIAGAPALTVPPGSHAVGDLGAGVASIQLPSISVTRPDTASLEPFPAEIGIALPDFTDLDDVAPEISPIVLGTAGAGTGAPFTGGVAGLKSMRYGRLYLESAVGSERAPLVVPLRVEYWDGVGFGNSAGDACTTLQAGNVVLSTPVVGGQTATLAPVVTGPSPWPGPWTVTLSAPNVAGNAVLDMDLSVVGPYPWLLDDNTDGDGLYNNNPRATAVFGLYDRSQDNRIYQREVFR